MVQPPTDNLRIGKNSGAVCDRTHRVGVGQGNFLPELGIHVTAGARCSRQVSFVPKPREPRRKRRDPERTDPEFQLDHYRLLFEATVDYAMFHLSLSGMIQTTLVPLD